MYYTIRDLLICPNDNNVPDSADLSLRETQIGTKLKMAETLKLHVFCSCACDGMLRDLQGRGHHRRRSMVPNYKMVDINTKWRLSCRAEVTTAVDPWYLITKWRISIQHGGYPAHMIPKMVFLEPAMITVMEFLKTKCTQP